MKGETAILFELKFFFPKKFVFSTIEFIVNLNMKIN